MLDPQKLPIIAPMLVDLGFVQLCRGFCQHTLVGLTSAAHPNDISGSALFGVDDKVLSIWYHLN